MKSNIKILLLIINNACMYFSWESCKMKINVFDYCIRFLLFLCFILFSKITLST